MMQNKILKLLVLCLVIAAVFFAVMKLNSGESAIRFPVGNELTGDVPANETPPLGGLQADNVDQVLRDSVEAPDVAAQDIPLELTEESREFQEDIQKEILMVNDNLDDLERQNELSERLKNAEQYKKEMLEKAKAR